MQLKMIEIQQVNTVSMNILTVQGFDESSFNMKLMKEKETMTLTVPNGILDILGKDLHMVLFLLQCFVRKHVLCC